MKNYYLLFLSILMVSISCYGQRRPKRKRVKRSKAKIEVVTKTVAIPTPAPALVMPKSRSIELQPSTFRTTSIKDSAFYVAQDYPQMDALDSIWKKELYDSNLYDTIYNSVAGLTYDKVDYVELPTDTLKARLKELNARTPFNVEYNASLESVIKGYLKNRHRHFERMMSLSEFYFPLFEQELDRENIPLEIKYLAIVESALNPRARSRVGATGLWQFMYPTGKSFGLDVSSYVDDRMDPIMATKAASKYLKRLHKIFGDWDLALASYNSGPGNVNKAIRRSGGYRNYWNIRHNLPRETAGYVPAFLATMYIFEYAHKHNFKPRKPNVAYFASDTIKVKQTIKLDQIAKYLDLDKKELQFLNPSYKLDVIPYVAKEDYVIRLPHNKVGAFVANENQIYTLANNELAQQEKALNSGTKIRYRVRKGDFLSKIAKRYRVSVGQLKKWNRLRSNMLRVGQRLTIYKKATASAKPKTTAKRKPTTAVASTTRKSINARHYTVKNGDSLWSISKKFQGISVQNLRSWNDLNGSGIRPGMKLKISKS